MPCEAAEWKIDMTMIDDVRSKMMQAMKEHDTLRKNALSGLLSALKAKFIDKRADLTPEEEIAVVTHELKQAKESLETTPADRTQRIEEYKANIAVLSEFMPEQMSAEEIEKTIAQVLEQLAIAHPTAKDKGIIMKSLMPLVKGKADGKQVNELLAAHFE